MKKICYVATIPAVVNSFLRGHILAASEKYNVTVICNDADVHLLDGLNARLILLPIERKPSLWKDVLVLFKLFRLFRHEQFDIVHSHMPKTALLGMLAAWLSNLPIRINTFHGEVWATRKGWRRKILKLFDQLIVLFATHILVVSPSQQDFLVKEGVLPQGKAKVIGAGSICGVDPNRFHPDVKIKTAMHKELGIAPSDTVILFLGRLNRDKGMLDLAAAFSDIASQRPDVVLVLVGTEEDVSFAHMQKICGSYSERLHKVSFTSYPEHYMAMADIFCLPSYREGFPITILEAAATGVPTVASRIYGITDAIIDGETGLLFAAGDVPALTQALLTLIDDRQYRRKLGDSAQERSLRLFSSKRITEEMLSFYETLLT